MTRYFASCSTLVTSPRCINRNATTTYPCLASQDQVARRCQTRHPSAVNMHLRKATSRFRQDVLHFQAHIRPRPPSRHSTVDTIRVANSRPGIGHTPPLLMHSHQLFLFSADATAATTTSLFVHITGHGKSRHITHLPIPSGPLPRHTLTYVGSQWPTLFLLWPSPAKHPYCWPLPSQVLVLYLHSPSTLY